jgi:hypothetical protein
VNTPQRDSLKPLLVLLAFTAAYVLVSSRALPPLVASHFDASGRANGFMPRGLYVGVMLAIVVGAPLVMAVVPIQAFHDPWTRLRLPHREAWLAPEQRPRTIALLSGRAIGQASLLLVFLCYAHGLVVQANQVVPPHLSTPWFLAGLIGYLAASLVWLASLMGTLRRGPH